MARPKQNKRKNPPQDSNEFKNAKKQQLTSLPVAMPLPSALNEQENNSSDRVQVDEETKKETDVSLTKGVSFTAMPQKKYYRSRAHCNPLAQNDGFNYPVHYNAMDWSIHYPNRDDKVVKHLDIGCGFGGLTVSLSELFPDKLVLGMEIRAKVCEYVRLRIESLRKDFPGKYNNAACLRTNCMRYLPNFLMKGQLDKIFICFPDPHFKAKNHRRRIISDALLTEYAYFMSPLARLYLITDVEELHHWHIKYCDAHPLFRRLEDEEDQNTNTNKDPAVTIMINHTEEGKKVTRMGGQKFYAVYERLPNEMVLNSYSSNVLKVMQLFGK